MQRLCELHGVLLRYLPAYSPDFNPIELSFHLLKQWMRKHSAMAPEYGIMKRDLKLFYLQLFIILGRVLIRKHYLENVMST